MMKIYFFVAIGLAFGGAYFAGYTIGKLKTREQIAAKNIKSQTEIIQNTRILDDKIIKTGLRDIRRILREEYTIAE